MSNRIDPDPNHNRDPDLTLHLTLTVTVTLTSRLAAPLMRGGWSVWRSWRATT